MESSAGRHSLEYARAIDLTVEASLKAGRIRDEGTGLLAEAAARVKEDLLGPDDLEVAVSVHNLGAWYVQRGEFAKAVPLHERGLAIRRRRLPGDDALVAESLESFAVALIYLDRLREARDALDAAGRIREASADAHPLELARLLFLEALLHRYDGNYGQAASSVTRALDILGTRSPEPPELPELLQLRGEILYLQGDVRSARDAWSEALRRTEARFGSMHPAIPRLLRLNAIAESTMGAIAQSRESFDRALLIAERSLPPCHRDVPALLNDSAIAAKLEGDYVRARKLFDQALAVRVRCLSPNHSLIASVINNQADLAFELGELGEAQRLYQRALRMWSSGLGGKHPYVARALDELGDVANARGERQQALSLYERALELRRSALGPTHPDVASSLASIAATEIPLGRLIHAAEYIDQALHIYRSGVSSQEPDQFARVLQLRADLELRRGDYHAAGETLSEALGRREQVFGSAHPLSAGTRSGLADAELLMGDDAAALGDALRAERDGRDHLRFTVRYLPERQALAYAAKRPGGLDVALSAVARDPARGASDVFDALVRSRGVVLDELAARSRSLVTDDPEVRRFAAAAEGARQRFANLILRSLQDSASVPRGRLEEAEREKDAAERALAERSAAARVELSRVRTGEADVRRSMPSGSVVVSFARYRRTVPDVSDSRRPRPTRLASYLAFVARADGDEVAAVPLGAAAVIDTAVAEWRAEVARPSPGSESDALAAERAYRQRAARLRRLVWDPISEHLAGAREIFVVPDGALNVVSFTALPLGTRYLAEAAPPIHYLSTERDLLPADAPRAPGGLLAVGGAEFGTLSAPSANSGGSIAPPSALRSAADGDRAAQPPCGTLASVHFADLPGSLREVQDIARLWAASTPQEGDEPRTASVLTGRRADEARFKQTAPGYRVLHLATHGFFLGESCGGGTVGTRGVGGVAAQTSTKVLPLASENPLLLAGLALAHANERGRTRTNQDDGILTAEEVSGLDLHGTEWAVLSACDTGLGTIKAGEGVLGLRRAFQIAGVRTVIMSLWSVDDEAARSWMRALYEARLKEHQTTIDAVRSASLSVLRERRAKGLGTHPFYWAGFVAAGDWR